MLIELSQKNSQSKGKWIWAVEWFYSNDPLRFQGKAYVPNDLDVWHYVASQHHDHYVRGKGRGQEVEELSIQVKEIQLRFSGPNI